MFRLLTLCLLCSPYVLRYVPYVSIIPPYVFLQCLMFVIIYLMLFYIGAFTDDSGTFSITASDIDLKKICEGPRFEDLMEHPFLMMVGLMYSLTSEFGDRNDHKEFLPFCELSTSWQMKLFFSETVEANLLFVILHSIFVPFAPVSHFNTFVQTYHVNFEHLFTQVTNMVEEARHRRNDAGESYYSYENFKLVQVIVAALCPYPSKPGANEAKQDDVATMKALLFSLVYCYVCTYLLYFTLWCYYLLYVCLCSFFTRYVCTYLLYVSLCLLMFPYVFTMFAYVPL